MPDSKYFEDCYLCGGDGVWYSCLVTGECGIDGCSLECNCDELGRGWTDDEAWSGKAYYSLF